LSRTHSDGLIKGRGCSCDSSMLPGWDSGWRRRIWSQPLFFKCPPGDTH
jgi:hypothetical protein